MVDTALKLAVLKRCEDLGTTKEFELALYRLQNVDKLDEDEAWRQADLEVNCVESRKPSAIRARSGKRPAVESDDGPFILPSAGELRRQMFADMLWSYENADADSETKITTGQSLMAELLQKDPFSFVRLYDELADAVDDSADEQKVQADLERHIRQLDDFLVAIVEKERREAEAAAEESAQPNVSEPDGNLI